MARRGPVVFLRLAECGIPNRAEPADRCHEGEKADLAVLARNPQVHPENAGYQGGNEDDGREDSRDELEVLPLRLLIGSELMSHDLGRESAVLMERADVVEREAVPPLGLCGNQFLDALRGV